MKKKIFLNSAKILLFGLIAFILNACFQRETYSEAPKITFSDIKFIDTKTIDSLILTFEFEDESGDIGLTDNDRNKPYHIFDVIIDSRDTVVYINSKDLKPPFYAAPTYVAKLSDGKDALYYNPRQKEAFSEKDERKPFNCETYSISDGDTAFIRKNPYYKNIYIEFQKKTNSGYVPIDFKKVFNKNDCSLGEFNARIPVFLEKARKGKINYAMISQAFRVAFLDETIRIKFYIYDRALHKSNEAFTKDFVLSDITVSK